MIRTGAIRICSCVLLQSLLLKNTSEYNRPRMAGLVMPSYNRESRVMSTEQFETISLYVCVTGLILYMFFIMYKLAQESKAGKFGTFAIFLTLGLGMVGFIAKQIITLFLEN